MAKKVIKGYTGDMDGKVLWVDTEEGIVKIPIEDKKERWALYCQNITITIDIVEKQQ